MDKNENVSAWPFPVGQAPRQPPDKFFGVYSGEYGEEFSAFGETPEEVMNTLAGVSGEEDISPEAVSWYKVRELTIRPRGPIEFI